MLARENRLRTAESFRITMRTGRKTVGESLVIYQKQTDATAVPLFGFVVSKAVGSAVDRNLVKRRLRSAIRQRSSEFASGQLVVVRALPSAKDLSWNDLLSQLDRCFLSLDKAPGKTDSLIR